MKKQLIIALWTLVAAACVRADCTDADKSDCPPMQPLITFDVLVFTAGPYGDNWEVNYGGGGQVTVNVHYSDPTSGSLSGKFSVSSDNLEVLRQAVRDQHFFDLPGRISPPAERFHAPDLRLKISMQGRTHQVNLYDPRELAKNPESARFFAVWQALFSLLPVQPSWK